LNGIDLRLRPHDYFSCGGEIISHDKWVPLLANLFGNTLCLHESLALYRRHQRTLSDSHAAMNGLQRIQKALKVDQEFYSFQERAARECAQSLRLVAASIGDPKRSIVLLRGSDDYVQLAQICATRAKIYSASTLRDRVRAVGSMVFSGGYWGKTFLAYGFLSFIKDVYVVLSRSLAR
jgi:hypothetical protein